MNYTTLQADIADYLHRTDLTTQIQSFIERARVRIGRDLRSLEQETAATLSSPSNGEFTLPTDFLELRRASSDSRPLRAVSVAELDFWRSAGSPQVYAIRQRTIVVPGATTVDIWYYKLEAALSSGSTEHPTMAAHPQVWLAASMVEAALYLTDAELLQFWSGSYDAEVRAINAKAARGRFGPATAAINSDAYVTFGEAGN